MITPSTTRQILETAHIEDVISEFLTLRRGGANLTALCPFHHEKTPSFSVSPARNTFKCFGCGKGGNAASFLMEHEGFSYSEALRWLALKYNIEFQETKPTPEQLAAQQEEESLVIVNDFAQKFFQSNLSGVGLDYLRSRGFTEATIQKFGLGFAPDSWDALTKAATQAGFKLEQLQKLGLTTPSGKDFFRNRVIFPIHNLSGKVIAFAGRILSSFESLSSWKDHPKYLNSAESPIYHKSQTLYGIHLARKAIRHKDECILVEGYTDLIALHQADIDNVVASAGTALTTEQLLLISRFTPNLHLLYDGDPAGIAAAMRGLDLALELDLNVRISNLPHPEDPDSFLRRVGITSFTEYLTANAKDFIAFKAGALLNHAGNDPVKMASAVHEIVDSIARVPDPIKRSFFTKDCASLTGLDEEVLTIETNKAMKSLQKKQATLIVERPSTLSLPKATSLGGRGIERHLVYLLLEHGAETQDASENITVAENLLTNIKDVLEHFEDPLCLRICKECIELVLAKKPVTTKHFIAHENLDLSGFAANLMHENTIIPDPHWEERGFVPESSSSAKHYLESIANAIYRLKLKVVNQLCLQNLEQIREVSPDDEQAMARLLSVQEKLNAARMELAGKIGLVR